MEWDSNFRLYMTSKLSNPHYGPEISGKTMIINYGVTQQGLMEQLLNVTVRRAAEGSSLKGNRGTPQHAVPHKASSVLLVPCS